MESDSGSAMDASAPPSRAPSIRPESPAMATTHSVNSLVETNTQRSDSASELAPAQPPGFLGPRVVRKRDRWSDGESDSMAPPAKRPEPDAISDIGAPSELGANASASEAEEAPAPAPPAEDASIAETERYVRLALDAHARSAPPRRQETIARPPSPRGAGTRSGRRAAGGTVPDPGRRAELPRAARASQSARAVAHAAEHGRRGGLGPGAALAVVDVRTGRRPAAAATAASPRLPSAWLRRYGGPPPRGYGNYGPPPGTHQRLSGRRVPRPARPRRSSAGMLDGPPRRGANRAT